MQHLSRSQIFKDYEGAFSEAMGLPLNIRGHDSWSPSHHGKEIMMTHSLQFWLALTRRALPA